MTTTAIASPASARLEPKPDHDAQLAEGAKKFERIFSQMFIKSMRESAKLGDGPGLFGDGPGSDTYTDWFDGLMAEHIGGSGGLGLQQVLIEEWTRPAAGAVRESKHVSKGVAHVVA